MNVIGLLDCNNFFVSCERLFRPDLNNRPVVVLSGNDGCVVARSNEVKDAGIPMGIPYFKVKDALSELNTEIFSSNFTLYRDISARVMRTLAGLVDEIEGYSIDESFFSLAVQSEEAAYKQLAFIKATVEQRVGVPVSLGAATSKTLAKYASEKEKRGSGVCVLSLTEWQHGRQSVPVSAIWGVGARLTDRLQQLGVHTVADFCALERSVVAKQFGVQGCRLYDELTGQCVFAIGSRETAEARSIMSTRSFKTSTNNFQVVSDSLRYHAHHAAKDLRAKGLGCQYIQIIARPSRHGDWMLRGGSAQVMLPAPTNDTRVIQKQVDTLWDSLYEPDVPYKKAGVILGSFTEHTLAQDDLFGEILHEVDAQPVMDVFDSINKKFGTEVIAVGRIPGVGTWGPARDMLSPRYTTNWEEIPSIDV